MSFTRAATLGLLVLVMALMGPRPLASAPVPVRFVQGSMHGFLVLHTANGPLLASGGLFQVGRGGEIESRMVFRFKDLVAFTPTPRLIQLKVVPVGEHKVLVGALSRGLAQCSSPRCSGVCRRTTTPGSSLTRCQPSRGSTGRSTRRDRSGESS